MKSSETNPAVVPVPAVIDLRRPDLRDQTVGLPDGGAQGKRGVHHGPERATELLRQEALDGVVVVCEQLLAHLRDPRGLEDRDVDLAEDLVAHVERAGLSRPSSCSVGRHTGHVNQIAVHRDVA